MNTCNVSTNTEVKLSHHKPNKNIGIQSVKILIYSYDIKSYRNSEQPVDKPPFSNQNIVRLSREQKTI